MKIRTGFVSNSSSSSFLIYGVAIAKGNIRELFENAEDYENEKESMYNLCSGTPLTVNGFYEDDYIYIGRSPTTIPENMTMGEWKEETKKEFNKLLSKYDLKLKLEFGFDFHKDCQYDG